MRMRPRVVVAMSGGVDSSLTAALLVEEGYDVVGVTMQLSDDGRDRIDDEKSCCSLSAVEDARRVAETIGIPHYVMNFKELFQRTVIDYFVASYAAGKTPNPCIACNRHVKFNGLLNRSLELEASFVATGHYARIEQDPATGRFLLKKGKDAAKDQSYVLYHLNQDSLSKFMFPLGEFTKQQTRELAAKLQLSVANKPESQEICFIPNDDYKAYLEKTVPEALTPGDIVDLEGRVLGRHNGVPLYTIGQRKGIGVAAAHPLYVIELDRINNRVVVGEKEDVFSEALIAGDLNWISLDQLKEPMKMTAKIRYGASVCDAMVTPVAEGIVKVDFMQRQRAVTPGQAVVFYNDDVVIGGGTILRSIRQKRK